MQEKLENGLVSVLLVLNQIIIDKKLYKTEFSDDI